MYRRASNLTTSVEFLEGGSFNHCQVPNFQEAPETPLGTASIVSSLEKFTDGMSHVRLFVGAIAATRHAKA